MKYIACFFLALFIITSCISSSNQVDRQNRPTGHWSYKNEADSVWYEGKYRHGQKVGKWKTFHLNGKTKSEGKYWAGKKNGYWQYFDADSSFARKGKYHLDKRKGIWYDMSITGNCKWRMFKYKKDKLQWSGTPKESCYGW